MPNRSQTYRIHWILIAALGWELVFWAVFLSVNYLLGWSLISDYRPASGEQLRYENAYFLLGAAIIPLLFVIFFLNLNWRNEVLSSNFSTRLRKIIIKPFSSVNTFFQFFFLRNAFVFLIIALANPQFGNKETGGKAESMEIIVALDISKSMLVTDMDKRTSRLNAAKNGINQLINQLHGDKIGLVVFAGKAYPQLALTSDYGAAKLFVNEVSTDMISNQGTNIPDALELAVKSFSEEKIAKSIIVITDGENHEGELENIMNVIQDKGIYVHAIGLGSKKGGPVPEKGGGFKKDESGNVVMSRLNPTLVEQLAKVGSGTYIIESSQYPNFKPLIDATSRMERGMVDVDTFKVTQQQGTLFALLSLLFLIPALVLTNSRWSLITKLSEV